MLIDNGISGFLFDPAKPEELADFFKLVDGMSETERRQIGSDAQEAVKTHLNEEKILNLLEGSYRDAIGRGVTTSKEAGLASLLSPGSECIASHTDRIWQRDLLKAILFVKVYFKKIILRA